jgi:hypothetical protein
MATQTSAVGPSHTTSTKLEGQAATAALYVTKHERDKGSDGNRFMDSDRISSAGMAFSKSFRNSPANSVGKVLQHL